ncbi:MAG: radical SAM protein [Chloroflexi bacterium]|nr:radical SAM protein [Chloroflexota bacterium]
MIVDITLESLGTIHNSALAAYAERYLQIAQTFTERVRETGIELAPTPANGEVDERSARLRALGATFRNGDRSIVVNRISPACEACQWGVGSATFFISLRCHRTCFYCFNPNQEDYSHHRENLRDPAAELEQMHAARLRAHTLALTGGEPLLYKQATYDFFRTAARLYPEAHTRLYTCGDHADEETLQVLQEAGLDEIRFSIRMHDSEQSRRYIYERIALAKRYIPQVMVEMPVLPGTLETMKDILLELDRLDIHSVNLLEFCYPYFNAEAFRRRGYVVRNPPHRVLYDYWYAGGLPIAGSEEVCQDLIAYAIEQGLKIGVHYCSLENKHTGQLYIQNSARPLPAAAVLSQKDYLLKSAKVFGDDAQSVVRHFRAQGFTNYSVDSRYDYVEFPVERIPSLRDLPIEVGISSSVAEVRDGERCIRELKLDLTTPQQFDPASDL